MSTHPVFLGVRARRALARTVVRRAVVLGLAIVTGLVVISLVSSAEAARQRWGRARPVAVATRDLAPGDVIDASTVEVRRLPEAAVSPRRAGGAAVRLGGSPAGGRRRATGGRAAGARGLDGRGGAGAGRAPGGGRADRPAGRSAAHDRRPRRRAGRRAPRWLEEQPASAGGRALVPAGRGGRGGRRGRAVDRRSPFPRPTHPGWRGCSPTGRSCSRSAGA